jgi:transposase
VNQFDDGEKGMGKGDMLESYLLRNLSNAPFVLWRRAFSILLQKRSETVSNIPW